MKLSKYGMFIKILDSGSFSDAARKLNYTQSAISQLVQSMESDLGVPLLHRGKKGISLTTEGERLLPLFYEIYNAEIRLHDTLFDATNNLTGTIRICAMPSMSCHLLPQVIRIFRKTYPLVEYQLIHGNYREMENLIVNGHVDFGFIRCPSSFQLDMLPFNPEPLYAILPVEHRLAQYDVLTPTDFNGEEFVLLDDGYSDEIKSYFKKSNASPKISQSVKGNLALFGIVNSGLGISIVPAPMTRVLPSRLTFKTLDPPLFRSIAIACKDRTKLSLVNKLFIREIIAYSNMSEGKEDYLSEIFK